MHTDRKIGFAMGILLVGIVAALFFRNEPLLSTKVPGVRRERELNQLLRERDAAVYLNDKVTDEGSKATVDDQPWTLRDVLKRMDERNKTAPAPVGAGSFAQRSINDINDEELDGFRSAKRRSSETRANSSVTEAPELMCTETREPERSFGRLPPLFPNESTDRPIGNQAVSQNSVSEIPKEDAGLVAPDFDFQPPASFEEYVVKFGDTLSGIAQRKLGSQKKYIDIYNANRDRMASPDRLDVGKPIRIPQVAESDRTRL